MELKDLTERFALGDEIGRGSIGVVYRAVDRVLDREVAVKCMRPELIEHRRHRPRFLREAAVCGKLVHPNIVPVIDVGRVGDAPALVMSLLAGRSLRTILRAGHLSRARLLSAFSQACNGVAFAHSRGIVHRDIKPAHVFVGDFGQVVLTDWGLAKVLKREAPSPAPTHRDVTRVGDIVGTPAYMAPEQAEGRLDAIDRRTDIYALGAVLYEILTGTRPYEGARSAEVLDALRDGPPEPPTVRAPHRGISASLEAVCLRAMARDPRDRFDNALDLAATLETVFDPHPAAVPEDRATDPAPVEAEDTATVPGDAVAARHLMEGRAEAAAFGRTLQGAEALRLQVRRLATALEPQSPRAERDELQRLEAELRERLDQAAWHLAQGVDHLEAAAVDPIHTFAARAGLATLHHDAWRAADAVGDRVSAGFHRSRAERWDDGPLSAELAGRAALSVRTDPEGVAVQVSQVDDGGSVWALGATLVEGLTPLSPRTISAARLRLRFEAPDGLTARLPLQAAAGTTQAVELYLPPSAAVPPGFVYVPGGRFVAGNDDAAPGALSPREVEVAGLCMARQPVTIDEYLEFVEDRLTVGADVEPLLPQTRGRALVIVEANRSVAWRDPGVSPQSPVHGISHHAALAYAAWLGRRLGAPVHLPTEHEWAYAAGAVDGRAFPWG
ncbi:MAG: protein kinase, partial [Myxococcales bacterium]|nr:protein kinase [Myxococcales bacterium]